MGASRYIGRVGGLAVALGVGTAIVTGQGVATAHADDPGAPTNTVNEGTSTDKPGAKIKKAIADVANDINDVATNIASDVSAAIGKHRVDPSTPNSSLANSIVGRVNATQIKKTKTPRQTLADRVAAATNDPVDNSADSGITTKSVVVDKPAVPEPRVLEWLSLPRVVAGRTADFTPPATTLWSPPQSPALRAPAPGQVSALLSNVVNNALSPFSGNGPVTPVGSPGDILLLAGTRREASTQALLVAPTYSIGVNQGVVTGCVVAGCDPTQPDGLTYTVIGSPSNGAKVNVSPTTGYYTFLPYADPASAPAGVQTFKVLAAETTPFDTFVTGLPLVGSSLVAPAIVTLQQVPVVSVVLAPLIGSATLVTVSADVDDLIAANGGKPIAYTTFVTSTVDGTQISTNFFPAIGTPNSEGDYPTILYGPGLAQAGATDPTNPFVTTFRNQGYNVVTWDPRGEFASGGVLQLDNPQYEGQDVSSIITWVAQDAPGVELDNAATNDPRVGMVGVSYGGGIQLVTAVNDKRIDAIAPGWAWNSLPDSLYPAEDFKTAYSALLLLGLVQAGATINNQIYAGIITGALLGVLTPSQIALLQSSGPGPLAGGISAPTLIISGTVDTLFPLQQSIINAGYITDPSVSPTTNPPVKVIWYCGGHGSCLPGQGNPTADDAWVMGETVAWMNRYVKRDGSTDTEVFEWSDQNGTYWSSTKLPSDPTFYNGALVQGAGPGKLLPIIPVIGGSGPQDQVDLPYSLGDGSIATNAVTVPIDNPVTDPNAPVNIVGAPKVTFTYTGVGTSRFVYGQIVDKKTGLVVGNIVTPIPVTLDGKEHTVEAYALNNIAYTMDPDSELELQITTTATPYLNFTQAGFIKVDDVSVDLPTTTNGTKVTEPLAAATVAA